ncbi:MAG: glycoside hydrolase family 44 protein [Acidobacteriota bacterium]
MTLSQAAPSPHPIRSLALIGIALLLSAGSLDGQNLTVYDDALAAGFDNWSWATHDLDNPSPVASGNRSIAFEADSWEGVFFHSQSLLDLADWDAVEVAVHGGASGGQSFRLLLQLGGTVIGEVATAAAPAGSWQRRTLDLRAAGLAFGNFDGVVFQDTSGGDQPPLFLDEIALRRDDSPPPPPLPVAVDVDPRADRRAIDPRIYGISFGDPDRNALVGYPFRRWGGNSVTRYNWETAVHNTASDYFFQNIPDPVTDPALLPHGSSSDNFVDETLATGAEVLLTAPAIGWVPLDAREKKWSFSQIKYGAQESDECRFYGASPPPWCTADSGNGDCNPAVNTSGFCSADGEIVGNDPADTSKAVTPSYIGDWVRHVVSRVGTAAAGGVRYWAIDNEPMLWNSTHRDVHPDPVTYDELWSRTLAYSAAIKDADPSAEVFGPVVWGWCAYFSSASDAAFPNGSCTDGPDRQSHGNLPLLEWYLQQVCAEETANGRRPIDYLDIHVYPQDGIAGLDGPGEDPDTAARRLRSVRELWDPTYVSESWINQPIYLIPRLRSWIDQRCPGVGLAFTEYRWGSDDGASSALAHAEALALFGREGVDVAARWVAPEADSRVEDAFELFLNYDGAGARVDGDSVRARSDRPDDLGTYAIAGPGGELWLVLINRATGDLEAEIEVAEPLTGATAAVYRFSSSDSLAPDGTVPVSGDRLTVVMPARSVALVVTGIATGVLFADGFESGNTAAWTAAVQ